MQVVPVADAHVIAALGMIERLGRTPLRTLDIARFFQIALPRFRAAV